MESKIIYVSFYEKKNSQKPLRTIFKITLKFITRPVLPHITVPSTGIDMYSCHGAVAEGRFELGPPVISDLNEKLLPLHRRGTPIHLESGLRFMMHL